MKPLLALVAATTLTATSDAGTWIVDDDGGPGVDFLNVADAVAAASPGDRIFVHPGSYSGSVGSDKGLTILGLGPGVNLVGVYLWHDIPLNQELRVVDVSCFRFSLFDCEGPVLFDGFTSSYSRFNLTGCRDVRAQGCTFSRCPVSVTDSRLELVDCEITGDDGSYGSFVSDGGPGGHALHVYSGGVVSLNASTLRGGTGGDTPSTQSYGGDGGDGAHVDAGGELTITGTSADIIFGGTAGQGPQQGDDGRGGDGVRNDGFLRASGASIVGGISPDYGDGVPVSGGGVFEAPVPADPFLKLQGEVRAGQQVDIEVRGEPGSVVRLLVGRAPILAPYPASSDLRLTQPVRSFWIGNVPASGQVVHSVVLPQTLTPGTRFVLQAKLTTPLGDRLTNSAPLLAR
ncbi:MAG: hypothetical protein H6831_08130 [Planctomycetes bacterium]|nr:hypothetical protein [Planctomycetota bacterium]MCB9904359.1 hypothetical protein [Planctomycetota bacterium]